MTLASLLTRLTCADVTPSIELMAFSTAAGQWGQVIPPTRRSICWLAVMHFCPGQLMILGRTPTFPDEIMATLLMGKPHICRNGERLIRSLLPVFVDYIHRSDRDDDRSNN